MDPDSKLVVAVTDGRGRPVAAGGLARWLSRAAPPRARGEVAIALVTDARMRALNKQYRRQDKPTDVLSFPAFALRAPAGTPVFAPSAKAGEALGDIAIATGVARRQAKAAGHSYDTELRVLALHGLLHLLGYDHDDPEDGGRMARVEARLRRKAGLSTSLIERTDSRLRPEGAAGGKRRGAARASESARGWGPARKKK